MENILTALLIVLIILFVFNKPICNAIANTRIRLGVDKDPHAKSDNGETEPEPEQMSNMSPGLNVPGVLQNLAKDSESFEAKSPAVKNFKQSLEGLTSGRKNRQYLSSGEWQQWMQEDELDPSVAKNHQEFTENIQRFYTGASFTSVDEDNRDVFSTNFVGLRRPKATPIGSSVRQIQDVDEDVLKRNKRFLL